MTFVMRTFLAAISIALFFRVVGFCAATDLLAAEPRDGPWLKSIAYAIPKHTTSEQSGYFSIIEGLDGCIYVGTAKYGHNACLVEFDPRSKRIRVVVDAHKEIKTTSGSVLKVSVPPGTVTGQVLRLKGQGMRRILPSRRLKMGLISLWLAGAMGPFRKFPME